MPMMLEYLFYFVLCIASTNIRFGKRHWLWYLFSNATLNMGCTFIPGGNSNLAALRPTICNTLNGPMYWGCSLPCLSFSFKCFVDNRMLSPRLMLDYLRILSACCLLASTYFISLVMDISLYLS